MNHATVLQKHDARPVRHGPRLLLTYSIAAAATSASGFLYLYAAKRIAANESSAVLESLIALYWTAGAFAPVAIALKGAFLASVVWGMLLLLDVPAAFARCLETIWSAEILLAAPQAIFAVAALLHGAQTQSQLYVPLGIDLFWTPTGVAHILLSHAVNVFLIAWGVLVFARLSALDEAHGRRLRVALASTLASSLVVLLPILQLT